MTNRCETCQLCSFKYNHQKKFWVEYWVPKNKKLKKTHDGFTSWRISLPLMRFSAIRSFHCCTIGGALTCASDRASDCKHKRRRDEEEMCVWQGGEEELHWDTVGVCWGDLKGFLAWKWLFNKDAFVIFNHLFAQNGDSLMKITDRKEINKTRIKMFSSNWGSVNSANLLTLNIHKTTFLNYFRGPKSDSLKHGENRRKWGGVAYTVGVAWAEISWSAVTSQPESDTLWGFRWYFYS